MAIFPLAPDQTIAQMWSNGARGQNTCSDRGIIKALCRAKLTKQMSYMLILICFLVCLKCFFGILYFSVCFVLPIWQG